MPFYSYKCPKCKKEKDVLEKWAKGEEIPQPVRPTGPPPKPPLMGASKEEEEKWTKEYDEWYKNDRDTFSVVKPKVGECLIYKPYQHVTYKRVNKNKKYQILVVVKNKDLKKNLI